MDEAQNLEWEVLEEIRLLGNLENRRGKMLQIILSGQPELDSKLEERELPAVEAADRAALPAAAVRRGRRPGIYRDSPDPRRFAGTERSFRRSLF